MTAQHGAGIQLCACANQPVGDLARVERGVGLADRFDERRRDGPAGAQRPNGPSAGRQNRPSCPRAPRGCDVGFEEIGVTALMGGRGLAHAWRRRAAKSLEMCQIYHHGSRAHGLVAAGYFGLALTPCPNARPIALGAVDLRGTMTVSRGISSMTMLDRMRRHRGWLKWSLGLVRWRFIFLHSRTSCSRSRRGRRGAERDGRRG